MDFSRLRESDLLKELNTSPEGLSPEEVQRRLARYGPNRLNTPTGIPLLKRVVRQLAHALIILLGGAAALAFLGAALQPSLHTAPLGWAIVAVIVINAIFTFVQEYKTERVVQALHRRLPATAWVIRSGEMQQVPREDLVRGDVLLLEEGEQVPADARLLETVHMRVDNRALIGHGHAKLRQAEPVAESETFDRLDAPNLVFAGTTVLSGHGKAVIYATGAHTEFGKIARATSGEPELSPLQQEITRLIRLLAVASVLLAGLVLLIGWATGMRADMGLIVAIGIFVANAPEGLLPTVTLALAMCSRRMASRNALVKRLTSVETLGCTTVICTDKTGMLTENRMRVERLYIDGADIEVRGNLLLLNGRLHNMFDRERWSPLFQAISLCNNAKRTRHHQSRPAVSGDATEVALVEFAQEQGMANRSQVPRMGELPFDTDRKRMSTLHWIEGKLVAFVKGAPEFILPLCTRTFLEGTAVPMTESERETILDHSRNLAGKAYRVLALATRSIEAGAPQQLNPDTVERDLTFLGLVGLIDPPHREVPDAIERCRSAGIRVMMITGDHPLTALAVARKIGLAPPETSPYVDPVVDGPTLDTMSDEALRRLLTPSQTGEPEPVFARMSPRHKMRIVSLLKDMGDVVAATGNGVNDAPALQKADVGIAMGRAGTDVAKQSADVILLDDNFATIVNAIEEGRAVYANVRKFLSYILASNVPQLLSSLVHGLLAVPLPLRISQILAVDLGTDIAPALALSTERHAPSLMKVPPRPRTERLLSRPLFIRAYGFLGLIEAGVALAAFFLFLGKSGWTWGMELSGTDPLYRQATTVVFAAIVLCQAANAFACRSERLSVFTLGILSNRVLLWGIAVELTLLMILIYTPYGQALFGTAPLPPWMWLSLIVGAGGLLLVEELRKFMAVRKPADSRAWDWTNIRRVLAFYRK